jgi:glycine cleavage system transcriptional repressor
VTVRPVGAGSTSPPATHILSVYGADRPGIVHAVATILADHAVNVTDVTTRVLQGEKPVYAMMLEVSLPPELDAGALVAELRESPVLVGVEVSIHPIDAETF